MKYKVERYCADRWIVTVPAQSKALQGLDRFRLIAHLEGRTALFPSRKLALEAAKRANRAVTYGV